MKHPRHICLLIACFSLGSCTLAVPQFEQLSSIFAEKDVDDDGLRLEFLWTADVNSQGKLMTLYTLESGGFVFASEEGDLISFDGWVVTSLKAVGSGVSSAISKFNLLCAWDSSDASANPV